MEEADRVSTILSTLVDIAEAEAGLVKREIAPLRLAKLAEDAADAYSEFADERQVVVTCEIPPKLHVKGDATALFRVFANLLDNAIKYTPSGGSVRVSAEQAGAFTEVR